MQDAPACPGCRWWRRLGPRSFVGRCGNKRSGLAFTNYRSCCAQHEARILIPDNSGQLARPASSS